MVIMKVPEDKSVNYATHTNIEIDESSKKSQVILQSMNLVENNLRFMTKVMLSKRKLAWSQNVAISQENILMSVVPTAELGKKLSELSKIRNLEAVDLENFTEEISKIIEDNKENFLASGLDVWKLSEIFWLQRWKQKL